MIEHQKPSVRIQHKFPAFFELLLLLLFTPGVMAAPLPGYNVDINETSVSGISSGGYMALQFAIAHSNIVTGVGVFAGGPYRCAADGIDAALNTCMQGEPDPMQAIAETEAAAADGRIAAVSNIARQRAWLFSGYNDGVVRQAVMNSLYDYVAHYVPAPQVYYQNTLRAGHAMITRQHGADCEITDAPFVNDCDYDGAGLLLQHIYGKLSAPATGSPSGEIVSFDQGAFTPQESRKIGLAETGYLYVPQACAQLLQCRVHVVFHGCRQYAGEVDDAFYGNAGYNQWADSNRLIILYPQTQATSLGPVNPKGCWDWWGYSGADFAFREGVQIKAVRSMLDQLAGSYRPAEASATNGLPELFAIDASDVSVSLVWSDDRQAAAYQLYRAPAENGRFERVNDKPLTGNSFVDNGLLPATAYSYRLEVISGTAEVMASNTASITTRLPPADCDPYFSDNVTHVNKGRAWAWFGLTFARGSWDYMGLWSLLTETALYRDGDGFQVGVCEQS